MPEVTDAIRLIKQVPHWDLAADTVAFPFVIETGGRDFHLPVILRQHSDPKEKSGCSYLYKTTLRQMTTNVPVHGDEMQLPEVEEGPAKDYVDALFVGFVDTHKDHDKHKEFLNRNSYLKYKIFKECVEGGYEDRDAVDLPEDIFEVSLGEREEVVPTLHPLYSIENKRKELIRIVHYWGPTSEGDFHVFRKATNTFMNTRRKTMTTQENYDVLEQLYAKKIKRVTGFCVDGAACEEANKETWIPLVPLNHKLFALELIFRKARVKNA